LWSLAEAAVVELQVFIVVAVEREVICTELSI
jgi:hypothetical protein